MTAFRGDETLTVTPAAGAPGIVSQDSITLDEIAERSPGGTPAGVSIVRAFPFAFDTPDLLTGAALYTPTPGDILLDAWIAITEAWDGTTPLGDFGSFTNVSGFLGTVLGATGCVMMDVAYDTDADFGWLVAPGNTTLRDVGTLVSALQVLRTQDGTNPVGMQFAASVSASCGRYFGKLTGDPIKVCVSQDGTNTGDDPASTQGAATLFLVTATPATA